MRIAVPKGRLYEGVVRVLGESGIQLSVVHSRSYTFETQNPRLRGKIVKARAIPQLVALGNFDVGFCGLDLIRESDYEEVVPVLDLGLNKVELVVAVHKLQMDIVSHPPKRPLLIATEYENIAHTWAFDHNLAHIVIQTYGSTEGYAPEDVDIVFDCAETGATLEANDLVVIDRLMKSTTHLVVNKNFFSAQHEELAGFIRQLTSRKEVSI